MLNTASYNSQKPRHGVVYIMPTLTSPTTKELLRISHHHHLNPP